MKLFRVSLRWRVLPIYCPRKLLEKYTRAGDMFSLRVDRSDVVSVLHLFTSISANSWSVGACFPLVGQMFCHGASPFAPGSHECDVPAVWRCPRALSRDLNLKPKGVKRSRGNYWHAFVPQLMTYFISFIHMTNLYFCYSAVCFYLLDMYCCWFYFLTKEC